MDLPLSLMIARRLEWLPRVGSTNDAMVAHATGADSGEWPDLSVVATDTQTQGRGRLGREWVAPSGKCLAVSVLLRPDAVAGEDLPVDSFGWLPLLAGAAMTSAVASLVPASAGARSEPGRVTLKWPNDVLIEGRKVCGVLSELVPAGASAEGRAVVLGAGVNLTLAPDELPVPTATSLELAGVPDVSLDAVLARYLDNLRELYRAFLRHGGDAVESGLHATVTELCGTLGQPVRAELPGGEVLTGVARELDGLGRLVIDRDAVVAPEGSDSDSIDARVVVSAGDITHLRY